MSIRTRCARRPSASRTTASTRSGTTCANRSPEPLECESDPELYPIGYGYGFQYLASDDTLRARGDGRAAVGDVHDDLRSIADENVVRFEREGQRMWPIVPYEHVEIEMSLPRADDPM